jgi:hypothetical protein
MICDKAAILATRAAISLALALSAREGLASPSDAPTPLPSPPLPACSQEQVKEWNAIVKEPLGIRGEEKHRALDTNATDETCPTGRVESFLPSDQVLFWGLQSGRANDGVHSWVFASRCKLTVCGTLQSLQSNLKAAWLSGEYDLNNNILVSPKDDVTNALLDRQSCEARGERAKHAQQTTDICFEPPAGNQRWPLHVEITPPLGVRCPLKRLWCGGAEPPAWREWRGKVHDKMLCVHGPLVADTGHEAKAEVHPTQLFWWKVEPKPVDEARIPGGVYHVFVVQEASSRFNLEQHFVIDEPFPEKNRVWRPWGQGPLSATFTIPFRKGVSEDPFTLRFAPSPYVPSRKPAGESEFEVAGVTVKSYEPDPPSELQVKPGFACQCQPEHDCKTVDDVIGTIVATVNAGRDREWEEGYLAMEVFDSRSQSDATPSLGPCHAKGECKVPPDPSSDEPTIAASVRWRSPGPWKPVPFTEDLGKRMFEAAGWSGETIPPGNVQRLRRVGLRMRTEIIGLPQDKEESEGEHRFSIDWNVCLRPAEPAARECPHKIVKRDAMVKRDESEVEVKIVSDALQVIEVEAEVRSGARPSLPPNSVVQHFWSHAFVDPENPSTDDTVKRSRRIEQTLESKWAAQWQKWATEECNGRRPGAKPSGAPPPAADGANVDPLPLATVESRVRRALIDGRMTVTEIANVVDGINHCALPRAAKPLRASR